MAQKLSPSSAIGFGQMISFGSGLPAGGTTCGAENTIRQLLWRHLGPSMNERDRTELDTASDPPRRDSSRAGVLARRASRPGRADRHSVLVPYELTRDSL